MRQLIGGAKSPAFARHRWPGAIPRQKYQALLPSSVPPAIVSENNLEWNLILAVVVRCEHINNGALLGHCRAIPFRFRHPLSRSCVSKRLMRLHGQCIRDNGIILSERSMDGPCAPLKVSSKRQKREGANDPNRFCTVSVLEGHASCVMLAHARDRRSQTFEGAAGMAKLFGQISKYRYAKPVASIVYHIQNLRMWRDKNSPHMWPSRHNSPGRFGVNARAPHRRFKKTFGNQFFGVHANASRA